MDEKERKKILREIKDLKKLKKKFRKQAEGLLSKGQGMRYADSARLAMNEARNIDSDIEKLELKLEGKDSATATTKKTTGKYYNMTEEESRLLDEYREWFREHNVPMPTIFDTEEEIAEILKDLPEHLREIGRKRPHGILPHPPYPGDGPDIFEDRIIEE